MIEQKITIQLSDDPFDTKTVTVKLPKGVKLLSTESYALDQLKVYGIDVDMEDNDKVKKSVIEENTTTKGYVSSIKGNIALIDVGEKYTAICYLSKEPNEIVKQLQPNMVVDVMVHRKGEELIASISNALEEVRRQEIYESIGDDTVGFTGKIKELIHGGYWVDVSGVNCFMPGSLGGLNKLPDFDALVGKELIVMPITYSTDKETIVVSHRKYLKTLIPSALEDLKENIKTKITGVVTGTTNFGVFAEFNKCLTGLIHKDDLVESSMDYNSQLIKPGDEISFWIKEIINPNKIILTQTGEIEDPWEDAGKKYPPMSTARGIVTKKTKYGVFVQLEKGISGLLHKSVLGDNAFDKGDSIEVIIRSVSPSERKISMGLS